MQVHSFQAEKLYKRGTTNGMLIYIYFNALMISVLCINLYYQEIVCSTLGNECFKNIETDGENCLTPCKGLYADVTKDADILGEEIMGRFKKLIEEYDNYKRGDVVDIVYPEQLKGTFGKLQILEYKWNKKYEHHFRKLIFRIITNNRCSILN